MSDKLRDKANEVKLFITDVDGVLTDGKIYLGSDGMELKAFNVKDGKGIKMLQKAGIEVAIITGRQSHAVRARSQELGIKEVHQGIKNKMAVFNQLLKRYEIEADQVSYIGDDVNDLGILKEVGFSVAVNDAVEAVKAEVDYVTQSNGGEGAIRELVEMILKSS